MSTTVPLVGCAEQNWKLSKNPQKPLGVMQGVNTQPFKGLESALKQVLRSGPTAVPH